MDYGICVRSWLDRQFPGHWIGRRGAVEWPPRSPHLTPLDFYLCGHLKAMVYQVKIRNMDHLKERIIDVCAHNTRCVKASSPGVGETHTCVLSM
jgi:hypothetical protein